MHNANLASNVACPDFLNDSSIYNMSYHVCNGSIYPFIYHSLLQTQAALIPFTILSMCTAYCPLSITNSINYKFAVVCNSNLILEFLHSSALQECSHIQCILYISERNVHTYQLAQTFVSLIP